MKYYIIAGERSGDLHAGNLAKSIRKKDPQAIIRGFGGEYLEQAGAELALHYRNLAFMGLVELFTKAFKIRKYIQFCKSDITAFNPDVIILIDYGGFNLAIARFGKKAGFKVFFYIPPKYWAWYQNRVLWLKPHVDRLFVILPFEKEFFKRFNWESDYVGNPVLDAVKAHKPDGLFLQKNNLERMTHLVALLPGSRKQEVKGILPMMIDVVKKFPSYHFGVAAVNNLNPALYEEIRSLPNVTMVVEDTYNLLLSAKAAIVVSGTATLETALFRVPQVVVYKANALSYWIAKRFIRVPFISLVNLIAGGEVVKEMLQHGANPDNVTAELKRMMDDNDYRTEMLQGYDSIIKVLDTGSASENAARLMVGYLSSEERASTSLSK